MKKWLFACCLMLFSTTLLAQEYTLGILAKRGVQDFYERWLMHASYLEQNTNHTFVVKPLKFTEIEPAVATGEIDFLFTNPSMYVQMQDKYPIKAILTLLNSSEYDKKISQFGGVIFTKASNSAINTLNDVKNKSFIAVSKTSLGGYQMAVKEFLDHDIDLEKMAYVEFVDTHDNVVHAVLNKPNAVGTVRSNILERMALAGSIDMKNIKILNRKQHDQFPYIVSTPLYPEWPLAALAKTPAPVADAVADALKKLQPHDLAAEMANIGGWQDALSYDALADMLRAIGVLAPNVIVDE